MPAKEEEDSRAAALNLLDFQRNGNVARSSPGPARGEDVERRTAVEKGTSSPGRVASPPRLAVATVTSAGMSRLVTSGAEPRVSGSQDLTARLAEGRIRKEEDRRSRQEQNVTVIVQRAPPSDEEKATSADGKLPSSTCDIPVPVSAFAPPLIGSGDSGKSSTDFTPFANAAAKADSGSQTETEASGSDRDDGNAEAQTVADDAKRPLKKRKMSRSISINTVLNRVGSKEPPLADALGSVPTTVQEIVTRRISPKSRKGSGSQLEPAVNTLDLVEKLWGTGAKGPSLPSHTPTQSLPESSRKATTQSNTESGLSEPDSSARGVKRALSAERALHLPPKHPKAAAAVMGRSSLVETGAGAPSTPAASTAKDGPQSPAKTALWTGKIKHRLVTAKSASTVELFTLTAVVPEKLLEQLPATLFVNALAGRSNVKLGKHTVSQCRLDGLSERQRQKLLTLAQMKLVAICELQHCTFTLVPFTDSKSDLRMVGFMIAEE